MKIIFFKYLLSLLGLLFLVPSTLADEENPLDKMLTERIKLNEKYRDDFVKDAKETTLAKELVPLEKKTGQAWVDYLTYVRSLKDLKLKRQVLHLEILGELANSYYDLEYAESIIEKASARSKIVKWKKQLAKLNKIGADDKAEKPATSAESKAEGNEKP